LLAVTFRSYLPGLVSPDHVISIFSLRSLVLMKSVSYLCRDMEAL
jgi:hypothetical protein